MKRILYISAVGAMALAACTKEEIGQGSCAKGTPLAISAVVANHSEARATAPQTSAASQTRAVDKGYVTIFENTDCIGIFVYDGETEVYSNKKWVYNDATWAPETDDDIIYYGGSTMTVRAYYPYNDAINTFPEATAFSVLADQSTLADYRASDLLLSDATWSGSASPLSLQFTHAMALVEVMPSTFTELESVTLTAQIVAGGPTTTVTLRQLLDVYSRLSGVYRAVLPAQDLATSLTFQYTSESYTYTTTKTIAGGRYYPYTISTRAAVGDYYYSDGSYSFTLNEDKECIGIVFREKTLDKSGSVAGLDEWLEKTATPSSRWSTEKKVTDAKDAANGAANMAKIMAMTDWENRYPSFKWCADHGEGWYLPALSEIRTFCDVYLRSDHETFNLRFTDAGGVGVSKGSYWSSTEATDGNTNAWYVSISSITTQGSTDRTTNTLKVRAVRAF